MIWLFQKDGICEDEGERVCTQRSSELDIRIQKKGGWRYVSMVKSSGCSCRGLGFESQRPHRGLKPSVAQIPRNLMPSSGLCGHHACTGCTQAKHLKTWSKRKGWGEEKKIETQSGSCKQELSNWVWEKTWGLPLLSRLPDSLGSPYLSSQILHSLFSFLSYKTQNNRKRGWSFS